MALSQRAKANLQSWARRGDIMAQGVLYGAAGEDAAGVPFVATLTNVPAKNATAVHADVFGDAVGPVTVNTGITNPTFARNLSCTFGATWDGGNVTLTGTDVAGAAQTEVITAAAGSTVYGVKVFKTLTSFSYAGGGVGTHATNVVSVGTGDKLGATKKLKAGSTLEVYVAGVLDASTADIANSGFTPSGGNLADGVKDFEVHGFTAA